MSAVVSRSQVYTYNFGTLEDSLTSGSVSSPTFLPAPPDGGSAYARVGTGGGKIVVKNHDGFGNNSSLRLQAPTAGSVNKFSITNPTTTMGLKLTFSIGDSVNTMASNINQGSFYFFAGNGAVFSNGNAFSGADVFSGVRLTLGTGSAALSLLMGSNWVSNPTAPLFVPYGMSFTVALYMNNGTTAVTYNDINNVTRILAAGFTDLFANGVYQASVPTGGLTAGTHIDDFMFYAENSAGNQANLFIDDIVYTNNIVSHTLPLKLTFFDALPDNNTVRLFWKAEAEKDIRSYVIEHSADGKNFDEIGVIPSMKTNGSSYTFTHTKPSEKNLYRLRISNDDGGAEYSHIIAARFYDATAGLKAWYNDHAIHIARHGDATLYIYDAGGRRVIQTNIKNSDYAVDVSSLSPGIYVVHVLTDNNTSVFKFSK